MYTIIDNILFLVFGSVKMKTLDQTHVPVQGVSAQERWRGGGSGSVIVSC